MYRIVELENLLKAFYPPQISAETQGKRLTDITALQTLISNAIAQNTLHYQVKEERLQIFQTQAGEKIYIQYPGKESIEQGDNKRPYDFRPKIMTANGQILRDLVFADMWGLIESLNQQQHQMLKLMACIFFRLGRMISHNYVEKDYLCEALDEHGCVVANFSRRLCWYELSIPQDIIESLNFHAPRITIDENITISLEAFLCFFELLLQNEDSKYYDKKKNLSSGRIPTSDSMLLLSSYLFGKIKLSVLLQRFVSGFGVARCGINEVEEATDGLVKIVDRKSDLLLYLSNCGIAHVVGSYITVHGNKYHTVLKTTSPKIAIIQNKSVEIKNELSSVGWTVYNMDELIDESIYNDLLSKYNEE